MSFNLATILRESAASSPDKAVAVWSGGSLTYGELDRQSNAAAATLRASGVEPGDTVGVHLPNIAEFLVAYFAVLKAGAIAVPMNVLLKAPEIAYFLSDSQAKVMITWAPFAADAVAGAQLAGLERIYVVGLPEGSASEQLHPWDELLAASDVALNEPRSPVDTAVLLYTSGTTGRPKGAELSHFQLYMNCDIPGRLFDMRSDDVVIAVLPLFHVFGLSSILNPAVRFGATVVLVPRFDTDAVLDAISAFHATIFAGVPTMYIALLNASGVDGYDLRSLRVGLSGGAPIPAEVIDRFEQVFGVVILEGYGLSETASTVTFNRSAEQRRVYSVGQPTWGVEVEVWDDAGTALPSGSDHIGELVVRGYNVMSGYLNQPEATAEAFAGGWFHTGDLGYRDDDGFYFIVDRKKELIIRGGYNVYPREVEEVLYAHPAVAEAAVIGVPDDRLGEEVMAYVALRPGATATEDELIAFVKDRLAAYKYPRTVRFVASLPKGPTGKIAKLDLIAEARSGSPPPWV